MKTAPSLLHFTLAEFSQQLHTLTPYFKHYQIDVTDGKFVSSKTVQLDELISQKDDWINDEVKKCLFDFDLMVEDYQKALHQIEILSSDIKVGTIFIHYSALKGAVLPQSQKFTIGIALDPQDTVDNLASHYDLNTIGAVQVMTVTPGLQGSPFLSEMLQKITQLKEHNYKKEIYLDGGINDKTIPVISAQKYKPDWIGPGSFVSQAGDKLEERVAYLKNLENLA